MHTVIEKELEVNLPPTFWLVLFADCPARPNAYKEN